MKCDICRINKGEYSAVILGKYHPNVCMPCKSSGNKISTGHADWQRGVDAQDHEHEVQQPYNSDGTINTRFAKLYPTQAKALFTSDELAKAMRK